MSKKRQRVPGIADEDPEWSQLPNNKEAHSSQGGSAQEGVACPSEAPQLDLQWMQGIHKTCTKIAICCLVMNDSIFHNEGWVQEDYSQVISKIIYAISSRLVLGAICFKEKQASGSGGKGIRYDNIIQMGVEGGDTSQFLVEWKHGKESTFNEYRTNDMPSRLCTRT